MLIMNFVLLLAVTKLIRFIIFMFSVLLTSQYALRDKKINNNSCSDLLIIGLRMFFFRAVILMYKLILPGMVEI